MKKFLLIALLGLTTLGCQKEELEITPNRPTGHSSLRNFSIDPSNNNNLSIL